MNAHLHPLFAEILSQFTPGRGQGPEGTDVAMGIHEAERYAGPEPLGVTVECPEGRTVPEGFECPHSCRPGQCMGCPAAAK